MNDRHQHERSEPRAEDAYAAPALVDYGTIQEWTKGRLGSVIQISIVL